MYIYIYIGFMYGGFDFLKFLQNEWRGSDFSHKKGRGYFKKGGITYFHNN